MHIFCIHGTNKHFTFCKYVQNTANYDALYPNCSINHRAVSQKYCKQFSKQISANLRSAQAYDAFGKLRPE